MATSEAAAEPEGAVEADKAAITQPSWAPPPREDSKWACRPLPLPLGVEPPSTTRLNF